MQEILDLIGGEKTLTITNLILATCIIFHLACEFLHYIYSFIASRRGAKKLDISNGLLQSLVERVEKLENTVDNRKCHLVEE